VTFNAAAEWSPSMGVTTCLCQEKFTKNLFGLVIDRVPPLLVAKQADTSDAALIG